MKKYMILMIICVLGFFIWVPFIMMVMGSIMDKQEIGNYITPILENQDKFAMWSILPKYPSVRAYIELLFDTPEFFVMFWNSCKQVFPIVIGQILIGAPAAWAFARFEFKYKKILYSLYIILMLLPFQVTMVSNYFVLESLGLLNSIWCIILPATVSTFPVFIMIRFFSVIPESFIQSAQLDGANAFQIFLKIGLPLGAPGILSAFVLGFIEYWNVIEQPLTFLKDKTLWPVALYLPTLTTENANVSLVASIIMLIPALLIFLFGQKYLEAGIVASGLKE